MRRLPALWTWLLRLLRFGRRVLASFLRNRGILLAGGVGYNALLSLVPFLTITVAALSVFFDEGRILESVRPELKVLIPQHADTILQTAETFLNNRAATGAVSFAFLLLFSGIAFRMLEEAMAGIFQSPKAITPRRFWISALLPYGFMLLLMSALFGMTLLTSALDAVENDSGRSWSHGLWLASSATLLLRATGFAALVTLFAAIYRVLPVAKVSVRRAFIGALCAAALWRLVGWFMVYYFTHISMVNLIYGSLASVIVVLLFLETLFIILLLGAQVIAELEASAAAGLPWHEAPRQK